MGLHSRHLDLDAHGVGTVGIGPAWFAGVDDHGGTALVSVTDASGQQLRAAGAAPYALAQGAQLPVFGGYVVVNGQNDGEVSLYFEF